MLTQLKGRNKPRIDCSPEEWALRVDLACAYRLVAHFGWHQLIYNHLTARVPSSAARVPGKDVHFLINPFGLMYREIKASNLLKIDLEGNKILPSPHPVLQAGFVVHRSVHMCREDVVSVMHSHSVAGVAVSCQEEGLLPMNLNSIVFDGRVSYHDCEGITIAVEECDRIAGSLGTNNLLILRNHGLLTCGASIGEAFSNLYNLELACQMQLAVQSSGAKLRMPPSKVIENTNALRYGTDEKTKGRVAEQNAILWAAMRRWMDDIDPGYAE